MKKTGAILIARQILESEIWVYKPSSWLKIWIYILLKVNYVENHLFERGENLFNWSMEKHAVGIESENTVYKCLKWLKSAKYIATRKTTRGMVIKVLNYGKYQDLKNYKGETESETVGRFKAKSRQNPGEMITDISNKENKDIYMQPAVADETNQIFDVFYQVNKTINYGNKTQRKAVSDLLEKYGLEKTLGAAKYAISVIGQKYAPQITNPIQLRDKFTQLAGFKISNTKQRNIIKI